MELVDLMCFSRLNMVVVCVLVVYSLCNVA